MRARTSGSSSRRSLSFKHDFRANAWRREENPSLSGGIMLSNQKFASVPFDSNVGEGRIGRRPQSCRARAAMPRYRHIARAANQQLQRRLPLTESRDLFDVLEPILAKI
jgi:hypothetical protein